MHPIQTVGIVSKPNLEEAGELVRGLLKWLSDRNVTARCDEQTALIRRASIIFTCAMSFRMAPN